jgi:amidohydrolase
VAWACGADRVALVNQEVAAATPALLALYRHFHAHPELSFQEVETARRLAAELRQLGVEVTEKVGGHGVVGVLKNGEGPTVLVRCDLDALPVQEQTGAPYASGVRARDEKGMEVPVMHACGHDVHMTALVGTARILGRLRSEWKGTVVFIGQPAEEKVGGARAMLADGLFQRFPRPDFALALHVTSDQPAGTVGCVEGFALANVDTVDVTVRGVGGHGAYPQTARDPIVLASQIILAWQTIVSREITPGDPAVITVGSIHGGSKHNIIPDQVQLQLTVRSYSEEVRTHLVQSIRRIARGQALAAGLPEEKLPIVTLSAESSPATFNDPPLTRRVIQSLEAGLGAGNVFRRKPSMGAEDFGLYGRTPEQVPTCMFWVGSVSRERVEQALKQGQSLPSLHSPFYLPEAEPTLQTGVKAMSLAVLDLLAPKDKPVRP